jgi:hypothetical protein
MEHGRILEFMLERPAHHHYSPLDNAYCCSEVTHTLLAAGLQQEEAIRASIRQRQEEMTGAKQAAA